VKRGEALAAVTQAVARLPLLGTRRRAAMIAGGPAAMTAGGPADDREAEAEGAVAAKVPETTTARG